MISAALQVLYRRRPKARHVHHARYGDFSPGSPFFAAFRPTDRLSVASDRHGGTVADIRV